LFHKGERRPAALPFSQRQRKLPARGQRIQLCSSLELDSTINIPEGLLEEFTRRVFMVCAGCGSVFDAPEGYKVTSTTPCPECKAPGTLKGESRWAFVGDPEASVRYLKSIQQSGPHLLAVANDILDFSKLEAGRMTLRFEDARAAEILEKLSLAMCPWPSRAASR